MFRFGLSQFHRGELGNIIKPMWGDFNFSDGLLQLVGMQNYMFKIKLKGWNYHCEADNRKSKTETKQIDETNKVSELICISSNTINFFGKYSCKTSQVRLEKQDETKQIQRPKDRDLVEEDSLTTYFRTRATG